MNLRETVSEILKKKVSEAEAMEFANKQFGILSNYLRTKNPQFPNGFDDWSETHYQLSTMIQNHLDNNPNDDSEVNKTHNAFGIGGLWDLARDWSNQFEEKYVGMEWGVELDWLETIEEFFDELNN